MTSRAISPQAAYLVRFYSLSYAASLLFCLPFLAATRDGHASSLLFGLFVWGTYAGLYLLPSVLLTWTLWLLLRPARSAAGRGRLHLLGALAILGTAGTLAALLVDSRVQGIYGFHLNGFVLNLLVTPGGIESMGAGTATYVTCALGAAALLLLQGGLMWAASALPTLMHVRVRPGLRTLILLGLAASTTERLAYGLAHVKAYGPILAAAEAFPLYSRLTFDRFAQRLGMSVSRKPSVDLDMDSRHLHYPLASISPAPQAKAKNLVWIVAESWRADALEPEIMPMTWAFAQRALRFNRHLSGGNGTRMGVFSMFYGLYGSYWFSALDERQAPALLEGLALQDYQFCINTSAKFTYPEFDQTVFVDIPPEDMYQWNEGESWERDRANVDNVLRFLDSRDSSRPFMVFSFLESPHARYVFPPEAVIRKPYLAHLNYATMSLEDDIELIRNRYLNSCHHMDGQIARVLQGLEHDGLLDDTIIVITGDHAEEFMEKGHWGHGSSFVDEQIHVPLILWIPGQEAGLVERMTSHLDLPATLLPRFGVLGAPEALSLGHDLLGPARRDFAVVADWSRICIVTESLKASFPLRVGGAFRSVPTDADDGPLRAGLATSPPVEILSTVMEGMGRFRRARRAPVTRTRAR